MKSRYAGLWLLLVVALVAVVGFSIADVEVNLGSWHPKKAPFREQLLEERVGEAAREALAEADSLPVEVKVEKQLTDSASQSLLIIGDSMTLNLALRLAEYAKQNGHSIHSINWDSSNTRIWASCDTLDHFIREYGVTFVFVSLGSNELYVKHPEAHRKYVERILAKIGDLPYVWIGPPNWKEDSGINDMIASACRPGSFFRSAGMEFERKKDRIHPTRRASAMWIDSIMRWMPKSAHPILADTPSDSIGKAPANVVFLKALNK